MDNIKVVFFLLILFSFIACGIDNRRVESDELLPSNKIKNIVILGNSIVAHPPDKKLGWDGDWGMAASKRDSDFVHILISKVHQVDKSVTIRYLSIASFEREYDHYDLNQLSDYRNADMLIVKISENVDGQTVIERDFASHYEKLIKYLAPTDRTKKIISDGFWPSPVNEVIKEFAIKNNYPFVTLYDLYRDDLSNSAKGLFANEGVANHPSDKGMRNIASRIWDRMSNYFSY